MNAFRQWLARRNYWRLFFYLFVSYIVYASADKGLKEMVEVAVVMWAIYRLGYEVRVKDCKLKDLKG